jgi:hypothetical protein
MLHVSVEVLEFPAGMALATAFRAPAEKMLRFPPATKTAFHAGGDLSTVRPDAARSRRLRKEQGGFAAAANPEHRYCNILN